MADVTVNRSRLPFMWVFSLLITLLFFDFASSVALWLSGGDTKYLEDNVTNFKIRTSVFDLALLSFVRCLILFVSYTTIEKATIGITVNPIGRNFKTGRNIGFVAALLVTVACLAYSIVKGILVYNAYKTNKNVMHIEYLVLVITSVIFTGLEFIGFFLIIFVVKKLGSVYTAFQNNGESSSTDSKEGTKKKKTKINIGRLVKLAKPEGWLILGGSIALLGSTAANMLAPLFFGKVIDAATKQDMSKLNSTILWLFAIYCGGGIGSFFRSWLYTLAGQRLVARVRKTLFNHILYQEIAFFDTNRTGELMNRLSSDSQVIQNAATVNISMLVRYLLQIIGSLVIMFVISPKLTGVLLSVVPIVAIGAQRYGSYIRDLQKAFQDELAKAGNTAEEALSSLRTVRSFSQEPKSCRQYAVNIDASYRAGSKVAFGNGLFNGGFSIIAQGAIVLVLWYGGKLVIDGGMSIGALTSIIFYTLNVAMAFAFLASLYGDFMRAVGASTRIFELFDRQSELVNGSLRLPSVKEAEMKYENVTFSYPSRPDTNVLTGLSFSIMPGETVALVGPSGGGKSTVMTLLERFYDPNDGTIYMAGKPLRELDMNWFRKKVAMVSQEPVLFASSIAENIAYGKDASQSEIEEAAKLANADAFIRTFEDAYNTSVGERGIKLSGGQKQRIAIARALVMDPDILLLDEATSALDAESEHLVQEAIDRAMVGRTVLVIAHRLSTVRNASRVIVIDKGQIAEHGTHDELIELGGVYKKLVLRQLTAGEYHVTNGDTPVDSPVLTRKNVSPQKKTDSQELITF